MPLVQGPGTAGALDGANGRVKIWDGTDVADVLDLTSSNPLTVAIVDGNGDQITSFGGGTQYTEDAAAAANPVGTAVMLVRDDAPGALVSDDGDNVAQRGTNFGAAYVQIVTSSGTFVDTFGGAGGTSSADDADFVQTTTLGTPAMGVYESTPTNVTDNDMGIIGITQTRALRVNVDNFASIGGGEQHATNEAYSDADLGTVALVVRDDALAALTEADGDYSVLRVDSTGSQWVRLTNTTVAVTQSGTWDEIGINDSGNSITVDWAGVAPPIGAGTEAAALRVTVATDSTGVLSVDDNGSTLSIDDGGGVITVDGTLSAVTTVSTVSALGVSTTGPQKAEDVASADGDMGIAVWAIRDDTLNIRSGTEGDYEPFHTDANGALWVRHTADSVAVTNAGLTELAAAIDTELQVDVVGALPAGNNNIGDVDVASVVPGTGATNLGKAEDAQHTSGDVGVGILGVRLDSPNAANGATADYLFPTTDMVGGIRTALYETDFAVLGTKHVKKYYTSTGAATDGIIWSPAAGARWYVTDIYIQISAAATITLEDDLAGGDSAVWKGEFAANSGWSHSFATPLFSGEDAADLIITTTAGNVYVTVTGYEI